MITTANVRCVNNPSPEISVIHLLARHPVYVTHYNITMCYAMYYDTCMLLSREVCECMSTKGNVLQVQVQGRKRIHQCCIFNQNEGEREKRKKNSYLTNEASFGK